MAGLNLRDQRLEEAARAGWLYYIAHNTQDEIATKLGVSRQAAQRLVALAVSEGLIKFRLDHLIGSCMEIAERLTERFGLELCEIVPTDPAAPDNIAGVACCAAERLERLLGQRAPLVICVGTGRTMRAAVEELQSMERPQHKVISLVGSLSRQGGASPYDVVMRLGDRIGGQRYPMPAPAVAETLADREFLQGQAAYRALRQLRLEARACYVGVSEVDWNGPLHRDGFVTDAELSELVDKGAVGEITGWSFDATGRVLEGGVNDRVTSLELEQPPRRPTVAVGAGRRKVRPFRAALEGRLISGIVTDEATAAGILAA